MNNLTTKGRYSIDNSNGNKTNCPNGVTRFILDVSVYNDKYNDYAEFINSILNNISIK